MTDYTEEELAEFDRITLGTSSRHQLDRVGYRIDLKEFIKKHGKDKCDAMFEEIQRREKERRKRKKA